MDAGHLKRLIEGELGHLLDSRVLGQIRGLLIEPRMVLRDWDYGPPGQQYPCWIVFEDDREGTGICYCESGFGPRCPWGLMWLPGNDAMGMDCSWFTTFLDAYFDSFSAANLPIWRVIKTDTSGVRVPLTDEGDWQATWVKVAELRKADPTATYDCDHTIEYGS